MWTFKELAGEYGRSVGTIRAWYSGRVLFRPTKRSVFVTQAQRELFDREKCQAAKARRKKGKL